MDRFPNLLKRLRREYPDNLVDILVVLLSLVGAEAIPSWLGGPSSLPLFACTFFALHSIGKKIVYQARAQICKYKLRETTNSEREALFTHFIGKNRDHLEPCNIAHPEVKSLIRKNIVVVNEAEPKPKLRPGMYAFLQNNSEEWLETPERDQVNLTA